uniref:Uncharacterized protein n=1 Tax=Panagrolaimus davidi TaxID=227884 RepID=A0A914QDC5_9BILA
MAEKQEIWFNISFNALAKLRPNMKEEENEKVYIIPEKFPSLSALLKFDCIHLSPEYYFDIIKWRYRMFAKEDKLWIDFQIIQNPMFRNFDAKFEIYSCITGGDDFGTIDTKLAEVSHKFGPDSFCSAAIPIKSYKEFNKTIFKKTKKTFSNEKNYKRFTRKFKKFKEFEVKVIPHFFISQ